MKNALIQATKINEELSKIYSNDCRNIKDYIDIAKKYANLIENFGGNRTFELNGKKYTMYNSLSSEIYYYMFVEDLTMMVYRLNNGEGFRTPELTQYIKCTNFDHK